MTTPHARRRGRPPRAATKTPAGAHPHRAPAGAPVAADAPITILDAAERLFAAQGFAATTVKQIGEAAGVNPALLYYYFTDKDTLYRAVIQRVIGGLVVEGMEHVLAEVPPAEAIGRLVRFQARYLAAHPNVPRIMARELADHQAERAEDAITQLAATLFRRVCEVVRRGQDEGAFRTDLDPRYAAVSTIAQVVYLFIARPAVGILLGHESRAVPDAEIDAFTDHAARFALAALAAPAATGDATRRRARGRTSRSEAA